MDKTKITALVAELQSRLPKRPLDTMDVVVTADLEGEAINCAPAVGDRHNLLSSGGSILYVEEILTFAKYHGLDVATRLFETGAGLQLY